MIRRFLCAGMLLVFVLSVPACSETKPPSKPTTTVVDPEGEAKPKAPGGKAG